MAAQLAELAQTLAIRPRTYASEQTVSAHSNILILLARGGNAVVAELSPSYLRRRLQQEQERAATAKCDASRAAHFGLAQLYQERLSSMILTEANAVPASQSATDSRA